MRSGLAAPSCAWAAAVGLALCAPLASVVAQQPENPTRSDLYYFNDGRSLQEFETVVIHGTRLPGYDWVGEHFGPEGDFGAPEAPSASEQETEDKLDQRCDETSGNPVVLYTGNKVEPELDFASRGEMPLHLKRVYNRQWTGFGLFGKHWLSNFDYSIAVDGATVWAQRPDGRRIKFIAAGQNRWNAVGGNASVFIAKNTDGSYTLHNDERGSEIYNRDGYVTRRQNEQGVAWEFAYTGKYLQRVAHSSGRSVLFGWTSGQLTQVTDPAGNVYRYTHTANVFGTGRGRLTTVLLPGAPSTTIGYHYEDARYAGSLTGKSFNGVRFSTFAYDAHGRTTSTERAGGTQRFTFSYAVEATETLPIPPPSPPPGGFLNDGERGGYCIDDACVQPYTATPPPTKARPTRFRVTETNPLGRKTNYLYEDGRKVSVTGIATANCAASYRELTYDANGFEDIVSDFADRLTDFDHDEAGRLIKTTEAAGTSVARTTLQEWDGASNRLTRTTMVGERDTRYTWTTEGRIASVSVTNLSTHGVPGQSRKTIFGYALHANGLLATSSVDGPLANDTTISTFSAAGDLLRVDNGLGHATVYANHNALGLPGRSTGPNGDITDYSYDARGRLITVTRHVSGAAQVTRYAYNNAGMLDSIESPDYRKQRWVYDDAQRPIETYEREADGQYARKLTTYNVLSQPTRVEVHRTGYPYDTEVKGAMEGISVVGTTGREVRGWACTTGQEASIDVDLYAGGAAPTGIYMGRYRADKASDSSVALSCDAQGSAYRFSIALSDATRDAHGGKTVHAHGISPAGKSNALLTGSGLHAIPRLAPIVAPTLSAPTQSTTGAFTVAWSTAARATSYRLEESLNAAAWSLVHNASATSKAMSSKTAGAYKYRVAACNETGCGPWSSQASVTEIDPPASASTPTLPSVNTTGVYTVSWNAVSGATSYRLEESANGGAWSQVHDAAASSKAFTGKSTTWPHSYRVRACNAAGCGAYSASVQIAKIIRDAQVVSHNAPSHMLADQTATITVTMRNTGNVPWPTSGVRLGRNNSIYVMPEYVALATPIAPNATATFQYTFTAPRGPVSPMPIYRFGGRMVLDDQWFGQAVPERSVTVENPYGHCEPGAPACQQPLMLSESSE